MIPRVVPGCFVRARGCWRPVDWAPSPAEYRAPAAEILVASHPPAYLPPQVSRATLLAAVHWWNQHGRRCWPTAPGATALWSELVDQIAHGCRISYGEACAVARHLGWRPSPQADPAPVALAA